jgi:hypothetical protein
MSQQKQLRKKITLSDGTVLDRGYVYLDTAIWTHLEALSRSQDISLSLSLTQIINASNGSKTKEITHEFTAS